MLWSSQSDHHHQLVGTDHHLFNDDILKDIGISDIDIALIYTVLPFTVFIAPPLVGFLADRLGILAIIHHWAWYDIDVEFVVLQQEI